MSATPSASLQLHGTPRSGPFPRQHCLRKGVRSRFSDVPGRAARGLRHAGARARSWAPLAPGGFPGDPPPRRPVPA
eukprot:9473858-Pyramimonas_sp.AAC.1